MTQLSSSANREDMTRFSRFRSLPRLTLNALLLLLLMACTADLHTARPASDQNTQPVTVEENDEWRLVSLRYRHAPNVSLRHVRRPFWVGNDWVIANIPREGFYRIEFYDRCERRACQEGIQIATSVLRYFFPADVVHVAPYLTDNAAALVYERLSQRVYLTIQGPLAEAGVDEEAYGHWVLASPPLQLLSQPVREEPLEEPIVVVVKDERFFVLTTHRIAYLNGVEQSWHSQWLSGEIGFLDATRPTVLLDERGFLWFGNDMGEWGGDLIRVEVGTGAVDYIVTQEVDDFDEVESGDLVTVDYYRASGYDGIPDRILDSYTFYTPNVTQLKVDPVDSRCILVSSGVRHFIGQGAIARLCGNTLEFIYSGEVPVWDLVPDSDEIVVLTADSLGRLYYLDQAWRFDQPQVPVWQERFVRCLHDVPVIAYQDLSLAVFSAARREVSVSGNTPYHLDWNPALTPALEDCPEPEEDD